MAKVLLKNITKKYREQTAVSNFNLEIKDREFIVMVGPSGCGKSTVLRLIAGLEEVTQGDIYIDDKLVNDMPPRDRNIAMVFQNYALYPSKTVYKNIAFGLEMHKVDKNTIYEKVLAIAKMLNIEEYLERKPAKLSGGQKQRVAIGRALVRDPKVFLMDEPLSNLDAKLRNTMRTEIMKIHRRLQSTIVYVTHDQTEAMTLGDRIVVMNKGEIQQVDTPETVYNKPANKFVAEFIGIPGMNFLSASLVNSEGALYGELYGLNKRLLLPKITKAENDLNEIWVGIRPEHLEIVNSPSGNNCLTTEIDVEERMGSEMLLHLMVGEEHIVVKTVCDLFFEEGKPVYVYLPTEHLNVFDRESGINITL